MNKLFIAIVAILIFGLFFISLFDASQANNKDVAKVLIEYGMVWRQMNAWPYVGTFEEALEDLASRDDRIKAVKKNLLNMYKQNNYTEVDFYSGNVLNWTTFGEYVVEKDVYVLWDLPEKKTGKMHNHFKCRKYVVIGNGYTVSWFWWKDLCNNHGVIITEATKKETPFVSPTPTTPFVVVPSVPPSTPTQVSSPPKEKTRIPYVPYELNNQPYRVGNVSSYGYDAGNVNVILIFKSEQKQCSPGPTECPTGGPNPTPVPPGPVATECPSPPPGGEATPGVTGPNSTPVIKFVQIKYKK